ncbi:MAG: DUF6291 domain-containing protein [Ruminococcus sp.]|nr:DUF6291 domain-containing protein [Ruminococcus sp.]
MAEKNYQTDHNSFVMYKDWGKHFDMLEDEEIGRLMRAVYAYVKGEQPPVIKDRAVSMLFNMMKDCFDRDGEKWAEICERNRKNALKGGRPKKPSGFSENQTVAKKPDNENDSVTVNDSDNETDRETDNDSVTVIDSKTDSKTDIPVGRSVGRSSQSENSNYSYEDTTPEDYSKVNLTDEEKAHLISLSDCLTVERYIQKIRDWQIRNRRINPTPYLTINRFFNEDNIKPHPVRQEEYKGISVEDYEAFARSIDLSRVTT